MNISLDPTMNFLRHVVNFFYSFQIRAYTLRKGVLVGQDDLGNKYYTEKTPQTTSGPKRTLRRWVLYKGEAEASLIPAEWYGWMHHMNDSPLPKQSKFHKDWIKEHQPNRTGTAEAYLPPGHLAKGGIRDKATGDYVAFKPQ